MGRGIRGEIWIWRLIGWLLCYIFRHFCSGRWNHIRESQLDQSPPRDTADQTLTFAENYFSTLIQSLASANVLEWWSRSNFAIDPRFGSQVINCADRCREDTIHPDMITILMRNDESGSGFGQSVARNRAKSLFTVQTLELQSIIPLTQPPHILPQTQLSFYCGQGCHLKWKASAKRSDIFVFVLKDNTKTWWNQ